MLLKSAMGLLIHTTDQTDAFSIIRKICYLFGCSKKCDNHDLYVEQFMDPKSLDLVSSVDTVTITGELEDPPFFPKTQREQSKFYSFCAAEYEKISSVPADTNLHNPLYVARFVRYIVDELLPYYPLWSGVAIKEFGIRRHSNAAVENWNKIIKAYLFDGEMRQLIPRAIRTLVENVKNRLVQRTFGCETTRQRRNGARKGQQMVEENNEAEKVEKLEVVCPNTLIEPTDNEPLNKKCFRKSKEYAAPWAKNYLRVINGAER